MRSIISPFSQSTDNNIDRIHQKFAPVSSENDLLFINCEKNGKVISISISRKDYNLRQKQIASGLISESINYSIG